jgi:hypothetical protein
VAQDPAETSTETIGAADKKAQATLAHYRAVDRLLADLKGEANDSKTLSQIGIWFDRYARKIDRLPVLDVDEDLLAYSAEAAQRLRTISLTVRGIGIDSSSAEKQIYGYYGPDGRRYQAGERRAASAPITAAGASSAHDQLAQLSDLSAQVRRQMSERYQIEF